MKVFILFLVLSGCTFKAGTISAPGLGTIKDAEVKFDKPTFPPPPPSPPDRVKVRIRKPTP